MEVRIMIVDDINDVINNSENFDLVCPNCGSFNDLCEIYKEYTKYKIYADSDGSIEYCGSDTYFSDLDHIYCENCEMESRNLDTNKMIIGTNYNEECIEIYMTNEFYKTMKSDILTNIIEKIKMVAENVKN